MRQSAIIYSAGLHVGVFLLAVYGLPFRDFERDPEPPVIVMEIAPIAEKTNIPKPAPEPVEAKAEPKPEPAPEPPKPDVKPEPAKPVTAAPPPPPPPPAPPPPKPVEAPKPPPPEPAPKPLPKPPEKVVEAPKPQPKPEPPKPQQKQVDFNSMAALVNKMQPKPAPQAPQPAPPKVAAAPAAPSPRAVGPSNPNLPLSISEKDFLAAQIYDKWNLDCGRRDAREHVVKIQFSLNADGSIRDQPELLDTARYFAQEGYRASAEAARRAVHKAVPFKFPPGADIQKFTQEIVLNFDPRQQCNS